MVSRTRRLITKNAGSILKSIATKAPRYGGNTGTRSQPTKRKSVMKRQTRIKRIPTKPRKTLRIKQRLNLTLGRTRLPMLTMKRQRNTKLLSAKRKRLLTSFPPLILHQLSRTRTATKRQYSPTLTRQGRSLRSMKRLLKSLKQPAFPMTL